MASMARRDEKCVSDNLEKIEGGVLSRTRPLILSTVGAEATYPQLTFEP